MGYTLSVKFKSEQEKDKMEKFLLSQSEILHKMDFLEHDCQTDSHILGDMSGGYAPKQKNLLGFHVRVSPRYIWDLCVWMAVKGECKDKKNNYFFYYDSKKMPITFDKTNGKNTQVNKNGIPIDDPKEFSKEGLLMTMINYMRDRKAKREKVVELFIQLNDNWNAFNLQNQTEVKTKRIKP